MPLQEISGNKIAIPRTQPLPNSPKRLGLGVPKGYTRNTNNKDLNTLQTSQTVKVIIITTRLFYRELQKKIEERLYLLRVKELTARLLYQKVQEVKKKNDFYTIIKYLN